MEIERDADGKPDHIFAFVGLPKAISNIRGLSESFDKRANRRRKRGDKSAIVEMRQAARWKSFYKLLGG
ncbi:MAG: hypothetical protein RRZ38_12200 [Hafnia sp.]